MTSEPIVWTLVRLTCPIAFASFHFHFPLSIYVGSAGECCYVCVGRSDRGDTAAATTSRKIIKNSLLPKEANQCQGAAVCLASHLC
jgi:hypothetical protein